MAHGETTDVSPVLSMAFLRAMPPYTLAKSPMAAHPYWSILNCMCLSNIPAKYLSWLRTNYLPMLMTPHYRQLSASKHTDLLLLPPLTGTLYPEWPHRQRVGLVFRRSHDRPARIAVCNTWSSGDTALCRVGGATSQLDLSSLTPLSAAGCGWLQLMAPHWATSVNYCK